MKLRQSEQTVVTLANAGELVKNITQCVIGNEVADTLNGSPLNGNVILGLAQSKFQQSVSKYLIAGAK